MAKKNSWYYSLSYTVRLVIAIIIPVAFFVHAIARITSGKTLNLVIGIVSLLGLGVILWPVDLVTTIVSKKLLFC